LGRHLKLLALIVTVLILCAACGTGGSGEGQPAKPEVITGPLEFQLVSVNSEEFEQLNSEEEFAQWYSESYQVEGVDSFKTDDALYVLLSAGEKSTGGYSIDNVAVSGSQDTILVTADLHVPAPGSPVTQAITYPNVLLKLALDDRELEFKGFTEITDPAEQDVLTDSGTYVGQIDLNSVEIEISGVPEDEAAKAFQLEEPNLDFEGEFGLQPGDQVKFTYFVDEHERSILTSIEKI
jgi:hypothetical protein